jgi:L-rhamnose mutarotase
MERSLHALRLFPGTEEEYDRRHANVWPELAHETRQAGIRNLTGFRRGTDVWYYGECEPDSRTAFTARAGEPATRNWSESLGAVIAQDRDDAGELLWYREIFRCDGPSGGPFQRAMFSLVVEPSKVPEYDERHARPWPELLEALSASGFGNYTGFRRGSHLLYYGEFHPDFDTAMAAMGATEVDGRWGKSFEGILTTVTGPDGKLITAREIYHQD